MVSTADQLAITAADLMVTRLGETTVASPMTRLLRDRASSVHYVHESDRVLLDDTVEMAVARNLRQRSCRRSSLVARASGSTSSPGRRARPS